MADVVDQGVDSADSPAASDPTVTPAGAQNTDPNGQGSKPPPFNQHPDWIRAQQRWEHRTTAAEQRAQQAEQRAQALEQRFKQLETRATSPARTPEEAFDRQRAAEALADLIGEHPKLKRLLDLAERSDQLLQAPQAIQQSMQAQQHAQIRMATEHLRGLAQKAGLPANDQKFMRALAQQVALTARGLEDGDQRFDSGDLSVLDEAFAAVQGYYARPAAAASVHQAKQNLRNLPPRPGGGAPGKEPPATLASVGGDERKLFGILRQRSAAIREAQGG